jgi:hypothetical protein
MAIATKPKFVEPNLHCCQIRWNGNWSDYASIKTADDMQHAIRLVETKRGEYRIVICRCGLTVVYA